MSKWWVIMQDLSVCDFDIDSNGFIGDVTGYSQYTISIDNNRFKTKRKATEVANKIKEIIKNHSQWKKK